MQSWTFPFLVPPRMGLDGPDPGFDDRIVPREARRGQEKLHAARASGSMGGGEGVT